MFDSANVSGWRAQCLGSCARAWSIRYSALYGEQGLWVRPAAMFLEAVVIDGQARPRFQRASAK